jgi:hypothetical protein
MPAPRLSFDAALVVPACAGNLVDERVDCCAGIYLRWDVVAPQMVSTLFSGDALVPPRRRRAAVARRCIVARPLLVKGDDVRA